jgi:hypothetical protein
MLDNDIYLIAEFFRRSSKETYCELDGGAEKFIKACELSAKRYIELSANDMRSAGKMFEFLGLAQPDGKSPIGWKPTNTLMELIADRATKSTSQQKFIQAEWIIEILDDLVVYDGEPEAAELGFCVLEKLGLVRGKKNQYVTNELISLIGNGYWKRRHREPELTPKVKRGSPKRGVSSGAKASKSQS